MVPSKPINYTLIVNALPTSPLKQYKNKILVISQAHDHFEIK